MDDLGEQEHNLLSLISFLEVDAILHQGNTIANVVAYQQEHDNIKCGSNIKRSVMLVSKTKVRIKFYMLKVKRV